MNMDNALNPTAAFIQNYLRGQGLDIAVVEFAQSTKTAQEAAEVMGCQVAQIAKSIIFRGEASGRGILVVTSGKNRVCEQKVAALAGEVPGKANAAFVREVTGFAIGGVPPMAHAQEMTVFIDEDLMAEETLWAAAGTPNSMFPLTPAMLLRLTRGQVADVKQSPSP